MIIGEKAFIKSTVRAYHIPNYDIVSKSIEDKNDISLARDMPISNVCLFNEIAERKLDGVDLVSSTIGNIVVAGDICEVVLVSTLQIPYIMTPTCIVKLNKSDSVIYIALKIEDLIFINPIDGLDFVYNNKDRNNRDIFLYKYISLHYDVEYHVTSYNNIDGWSRHCHTMDVSSYKLLSDYTFLGRFPCDFIAIPDSATKFKDIRDVPLDHIEWILGNHSYYNYYRDVAYIEVCSECNTYVHSSESIKLGYNDITLCGKCHVLANMTCDMCYIERSPIDFKGKMFYDYCNSEYKNNLKLNNIENICDRCLHHSSKSCGSCEETYFIDSGELKDKNKDDKHTMYMELTDRFNRFNGSDMCLNCYTIIINKNSVEPIRGRAHLVDIGKHTSKMVKVDRFISVESELITYYDDYEEARDNVHIPRNWTICQDSSLSSGGVEYKTINPVRGDNIYRDLTELERIYNQEGMTIDSTCGIHIHINALDFGFKDMKNLLLIYNSIDSTIFDSMHYSRRENSNCQPLNGVNADIMGDVHNMRDLVNYWYRVMSKCEPDESHYNNSRYHGLNLHSKFYHGTIEFRYHEGEISPEPIISWIEFCNSTMSLAREMSLDKSNGKALKSLMLDSNVSGLEVISNMGRDNLNYIENRIKENN